MMDSQSAEGKEAYKHELFMAECWMEQTGCQYIKTAHEHPARADALILEGGKVRGIAETKCRYNTVEDFERWNWEWLITFEKIDTVRAICPVLNVPMYGFLYCVNSKELLVEKLADESGAWVCNFRTDNTETQRTCNDSMKVTRKNIFVDVRKSRRYSFQGENLCTNQT